MVRAKNLKNAKRDGGERRAVAPGRTAVPAVPEAVESGAGGDLGQSPSRFMALVWGLPIGVVLLSLVFRNACLGG